MTASQTDAVGNLNTVSQAILTSTINFTDSENPCPANWTGNRVSRRGGGPVSATTARVIRACNSTNASGAVDTCVTGLEGLLITNHTSGETLPPFNLTLLDTYNNSALGEDDTLVRVSTRDEVVLGGQLIAQARDTIDFTVIRMVARVDETYTLTLEFDPQILPDVTVRVQVRPCSAGEVLRDDGERCEECPLGLFSFDPMEECRRCTSPDRICKASTVTPNDGFWHSTSVSDQIHGCIFADGCSYGGRLGALERSAADAHAHGRALRFDDDMYPQCDEVRSRVVKAIRKPCPGDSLCCK